MMAQEHKTTIRERFARKLDNLQEDVLRMGNLVAHDLTLALKSLEQSDFDKAQHIIQEDAEIDAARNDLEERAITLIATQQPVASDLRLIGVVFAVASELERIGDYAVHIARRLKRASKRPMVTTMPIPPAFHEMADLSVRMLQMSMDAFVQQDEEKARSLTAYDEQVDALEFQIRSELVDIARTDTQQLETILDMLDIVHTLERVADRSTNIGERVVYLVTSSIEELNP